MISEYIKAMNIFEKLGGPSRVKNDPDRAAKGEARRKDLWLVNSRDGISYYAPSSDLVENPNSAHAGEMHSRWKLKPGKKATWKIEHGHLTQLSPEELQTTDIIGSEEPTHTEKPQATQRPTYKTAKARVANANVESGNHFEPTSTISETAERILNPTSKNDPFNKFDEGDRREIAALFVLVTDPKHEDKKEKALSMLINKYHMQFSSLKDGIGVSFQTPDQSKIATFPPNRSLSIYLSRLGVNAVPKSYSFKPQQLLRAQGTYIKASTPTEASDKISITIGKTTLEADSVPTPSKLEAMITKSAPSLSPEGVRRAIQSIYPTYELHSRQMEVIQKMFKNGQLNGVSYGGKPEDAGAIVSDIQNTIREMNISGGNDEQSDAQYTRKGKVTTILDKFAQIPTFADDKFIHEFNEVHAEFMREITKENDALKDNLADICENLSILRETLRGKIVLVPFDPNFPNIDFVAIDPDIKQKEVNFEDYVAGLQLTEVSVDNLHDIKSPADASVTLASVKKDEGAAGKQIERVNVTSFKDSKQLGLSAMDIKRDLSYIGHDAPEYFNPVTKQIEQSYLDMIQTGDNHAEAFSRVGMMYDKYAMALLTYSDMVDDDDLDVIAMGGPRGERLKNVHMERLMDRVTGKDPALKGRAVIPRPRVRSATGTQLPTNTHLHSSFKLYMLGAFFSEAVYNTFSDHQGFINQKHDAKNGGIDETNGNIPPDEDDSSLALVNVATPDGVKFVPYKARLVNTPLKQKSTHKRITGYSSDYRNNKLIEHIMNFILR